MNSPSLHPRRRFLKTSVGASLALGIDARLPKFLLQAAEEVASGDERILVVVQLSGGNDGLNTVVPYRHDAYRAARPKLAISPETVLKIDGDLGLHPSLMGMQQLLDDGRLAIVQGVGYDQPNRSHFESMDIWHTCQRKGTTRVDGWLGRFLNQHARAAGGDVPALHLGRNQQPLALSGRQVRVPSVSSLDEFQLQSNNREALRSLLADLTVTSSPSSDDLLGFVQTSTSSAMLASRRVAEASQGYRTELDYPDTDLARKLRVVAQLIDSGLSTRIYYVELDGFDTHAEQAETHAILLREWSGAVSTFVNDLAAHGHAERVCVMSFSEFGRRVAENASGGTDHGAAAPMFLSGGGIAAGVLGSLPNLDDLQDGDIKHTIDFRQVYAAVLEQWLGIPATQVLDGQYAPLPLFRQA